MIIFIMKDGDFLKISKIKKTSSGKYNLILENNEKITTYDDVILKNNILYNKELNTEQLNKLNIDTNYYDIYNKCIRLISTRLRSEKEISDYLDKNNVTDEQKDIIISELKINGLINDRRFAKAFITDKLNFSTNGPIKIKNMLIENNVDVAIINEEMENVDKLIYLDKIKKIIDRKIKANKKHSNFMLKQKLMNDLILLGFYRDDINSCLNNVDFENNDLIENNYDSLYKKLCLKYTGNNLYKKIKEKLYQKGFSLSEIDDILSKKFNC